MVSKMTWNKKLNDKHCKWVLWQMGWFCKSFDISIITWFADIMTDFCYKELIEIGDKSAFTVWYIFEGHFCIADPIISASYRLQGEL